MIKSFYNKNQIIALEFYFIDLIRIVNELNLLIKDQENNANVINVRNLVSKLINKDITLGLSQRTLLSYVSELIDYLKEKTKNLKIQKKTFQTLFDDGIKKECGKCHELKPWVEFSK